MPTKKQVRKYLRRAKNGWELYRDTDHEYYRKELPGGELIFTRLSHGNGEIPPRVWQAMMKQMHITQEDFNRGL